MAGHKTINVCQIISGDLWAGAEVQMYTLMETLIRQPDLHLSAIVLNHGKLASKLMELGLDVAVLDESRSDFVKLRRLTIEYLRDKNIDIIHSHRFKENILAASIRKRCKVKYLVQTVHGIGEPRRGIVAIKSRLMASFNRAVTRRYFDKIITVSDDIQQQLGGHYPASKLITIHNAVDPDRIKPASDRRAVREQFGISPDTPLIGAAGRMVPVKAYDFFLSMAHIILESNPDVRFMLIGDGPLKQSLQDMAVKMNIQDKVIFPGFRDDIIDIVNALDIFVFSSFHEGVPMALLEAMALKKAVVSTAVGGICEVLQDGVSGSLVEPRSPQALADACLTLLGDKGLMEKYASNAFERLSAEFSSNILGGRVSSLYNGLIGQKA